MNNSPDLIAETTATAPRLMGIWAHPDDESFGMAGSMAQATMTGHPVAIVCATRGEEGEIADPALATPENLGAVREGELRRACAAVGVTDVSFLDYRDGHLSEADPDEVVRKVVYHLRRFRPDVIVTFAANGGYGHPDHMAVHRAALAAVAAAADPTAFTDQLQAGLRPHRVRKVYYNAFVRERMIEMREEARKAGHDFIPGGNAATIPFEEMGTPMADVTTFVKLTDAEFEKKRTSMLAHATQLPADGPFASATPEQMRQFMGTEVFQLTRPPISAADYPRPENDLFAGL